MYGRVVAETLMSEYTNREESVSSLDTPRDLELRRAAAPVFANTFATALAYTAEEAPGRG